MVPGWIFFREIQDLFVLISEDNKIFCYTVTIKNYQITVCLAYLLKGWLTCVNFYFETLLSLFLIYLLEKENALQLLFFAPSLHSGLIDNSDFRVKLHFEVFLLRVLNIDIQIFREIRSPNISTSLLSRDN